MLGGHPRMRGPEVQAIRWKEWVMAYRWLEFLRRECGKFELKCSGFIMFWFEGQGMMSHPSYPLNLTPWKWGSWGNISLLRSWAVWSLCSLFGACSSTFSSTNLPVIFAPLGFFLGKSPLLPMLSVLGVGRESVILAMSSCFVVGLSHIWL